MEDVSVGHQKMKREQDSLLTFDFQISAAAAQGGRRYMEDRLQIEVGRAPNGELDFIFAAVYDGHGGVQASDYAYTHLFQHIVNNQAFFSNDDNEVLEAIRSGFLRTQLDMHKAAEQWPPTSTGFPCTAGTTATCAIIRNGKLYTGHVGDSSIILANFMEEEAGYTDGKLTEDHKPESKAERIRIEKAGGAIASKSGIFRVVWKRPMRGHRGPIRRSTLTENIPFLAVARSLGDFWSLNPDNNQYVISPDPDVDVFRLKNTDNFIIIASDGLTNVLTVSSIIGILRDEKKAASSPFSDGANKNEQQNYQLNYAHSLLQSSLEKWGSLRADNISIICIKLNADEIPEKHPSIAEEHAGGMDIGQQLIDHPCSVIHVNQTRTFRLMAPFIRTGVKRKLQESEDEDGYIRHIPTNSNAALILDVPSASSSSSFSPSKKLCRKEEHQEDEEEAFLKPPPAKRSKLQSVFNFFTNLFK